MRPSRNINDVSSTPAENHPMFLRQLSSSGSSFLPCSRPALCRAGFRSSGAPSYRPHIPAPHPWWSVRGFPPRPPRLPCSPPPAQQVFSGRTLHPRSISTGSWRSFHTSAGLLMDRTDRDKEPPHKRRKSEEEKRSISEREGHGGGAAGSTGGSKKEHRHPDSSKDSHPRPNHRFKDGSADRGSSEAGKGLHKENSREKDVERTKTWNKDRQRKDSCDRDETPNRGWSTHHQGGNKDPQTARSRGHTPKSKPEQDEVPPHKPNPWFKERAAEQQRGSERNTKGPEGQLKDRSSDGGQWPGLPSRPSSTTRPSNPNPWQVAGTNSQPPPPGTCPPGRQQDDVKQSKSLQRHWESLPVCGTDIHPPGVSKAFDFSVMSYNILSQELLQDNAYLYRHCHPSVLQWDCRLPNLLAEIQQHNADILCLQEVQEDHYINQIKPSLQALGYQCEYKKRTGRKPDGCAVVFKSSRLSLLSSNPVEFFRPGDALLDRDNVGLVVLLKPKDVTFQSDPSTFICVANTHLLYNPRRGDIKLAQLAILLAEIRRLNRLPDGSTNPVVLCGDFNSTPWSPLYSFLTTGSLDYRGLQISTVSGQESSPRGQRLLNCPIWSHSLGIDSQCQYRNTDESSDGPTAVEGAISNLTVEDLANKSAFDFNRPRIEHGLKLQSSYQHHLMPDGRPEVTTCHSRTAMTVDYILYTPDSMSGLVAASVASHPASQPLCCQVLVAHAHITMITLSVS
ncbi:protein angel homolog 2 isoform X3 [Acanthopagrus latus]|uniref:protein angel homolog 2 isoform X3 n=1 Tax=Acanthopagrus latus TaxID=8177 RepID=UPI00187C7886|nr:protein angel homolog 2 isoform X3 [Acanthopagrus latus]